ncbi:MAG: A24 family peptidase [Candidatus Diapherotrites archaeon]|nr:A24 family peptidase [Candidatus Diapherotrites archaeon]
MFLEDFRFGIILLCALISTYTDIKKGLIYDKVTYPMIALGAFFVTADIILGESLIIIFIPALVFAFTYVLYYAGKLGGGDVKFLLGLSLLLPFYKGKIFVLSVVLIASLTSAFVIPLKSIIKVFLSKNKKKIKLDKESFKALALGIFVVAYLYFLYFVLNAISLFALLAISLPLFFSLIFIAFKSQIQKELFLQWVNINQLDEDEIVAKEYLEKDALQLLGSFKGVISEKEKELLKKKGIKKVPVYRNLPPFAPFLLFGILVSWIFPSFLDLLFSF